MDTLQAMALSEATRSLDAQQRSLESLRTRAIALFSAAAVVFSLLTAGQSSRHHVAWLFVPALVSFGLIGLLGAWILLPRSSQFRNGIVALIDEADLLKEPVDAGALAAVQRDWALWGERNYVSNQKTIDGLLNCYTAGIGLLFVEVLFLSIRAIT
jgi:hypothetical protein